MLQILIFMKIKTIMIKLEYFCYSLTHTILGICIFMFTIITFKIIQLKSIIVNLVFETGTIFEWQVYLPNANGRCSSCLFCSSTVQCSCTT